MRFFPITFVTCLCLCVLWTAAVTCSPSVRAGDSVRFKWALLYDTEEGLKAVDFKDPPTFEAQTTLQFFFHPSQNTYLYLLLLDSSKVFSPVFPVARDYYDNFRPGEILRIPGGEGRFTVFPPAGQETFYLLASTERLSAIEELMEHCMLHPEDTEKQAALFQQVRLLRRKHSKLTQYTEKGVPISGTMSNLTKTRGTAPSETFAAAQVEADGFYSKIIRVQHE